MTTHNIMVPDASINTSRRSLFAGIAGAAAVAATPAFAVSSSGAKLISACGKFHQVQARVMADDGSFLEGLLEERWRISSAIMEMRPSNFRELQAKAGVALAVMEESEEEDRGADWEHAVTVLRDLVGERV